MRTPAGAHHTEPARIAARWLGTQLRHGRMPGPTGSAADWGLTIDTAIALVAARTDGPRVSSIAAAISHNYLHHYAIAGGITLAGPLAKSLVAAEVLGKNPAHFGGRNLRRLVMRRIASRHSGFQSGRARDSGNSDSSNVFSQAFAVIGLARSGGVPQRAVRFLLKQQCGDGYFRIDESARRTCTESGSEPDIDATSLAIQALKAATASGAHVPGNAIASAASWLAAAQKRNGGFAEGSGSATNADSTGLAAVALAATHRGSARRRATAFVSSLQLTSRDGPARLARGAIAYDTAAYRRARRDGVGAGTIDQFRRATVQGILAFAPRSLATLTLR